MMVMTHVVPEQNVSWAEEFAAPPAVSAGMSWVVLSEARLTW
jgi:hypothetical protein